MVNGRVKIISSGFTIAFSRANTRAKMMAVENELVTTYGSKSFDNIYTATAVRSRLIINLIIQFFKSYIKLQPIQKNLRAVNISLKVP